jgi:hypothetical protein
VSGREVRALSDRLTRPPLSSLQIKWLQNTYGTDSVRS